MISFKTRADILPSTITLLAILILCGALLYTLLVPLPQYSSIDAVRTVKRAKMTNDILFYQKRQNEALAAISPRVWNGTTNHVIASVLALVTSNSDRQAVKLTAFRPQRTQDLDGVTELPFTIQLAGSYPAIRQVMRTLDSGGNKVVLRSVQVNASEQITNSVTATLGISTYIATPELTASSDQRGAGNG